MALCEPVQGLVFDEKSKEALAKINQRKEFSAYLSTALSVGMVSSIFTKSNLPTASYNITQADWGLYKQAVGAIPEVVRGAIEKEAMLMSLHYVKANDRKLASFWEGIASGCK
ncbi:hypothetical protein [Pseudomonas paralcaligenes]|uniref:hypothetical protein n=1 Tax=Pseudomonas paralcaligenes TaxID=2772558 RepID=UPI001C806AB7|nr:hypothetical protein [Pseudomonas paralcaligenes]